MQLEHAFPGVEHPAEMLAEPACDVLDLDLGHQIQVQLRPQLRQRSGQDLGALVGRFVVVEFIGDLGVDELRERRQVADRLVREAATDDDCLQIDVEPCGDQRLIAGRHHNELVDELVVWTTPAAHLFAQRALLRLRHRLDYQHLEIRLVALCHGLVLQLTRVGSEHVVFVQAGVLDVAGAERLGGQRSVDPGNRVCELVVATRREQPLDPGELRRTWICPVRFERCQVVKSSLQIATYSSLSSPFVVGRVRRSAASSNRHQASLRNCHTLLYSRELSLTADPFVGSSVAEQLPPAGGR